MSFVALDFGGTKHAAAAIAVDTDPALHQWQGYQRQQVPPGATATIDLDMMRSLIQTVLQGKTPTAIGVSFGGPVDAATGTVRLSHHVPGWENVPLREILTAEYGVPVAVDNDANVAALGEYRFGAGQGYDSLLYMTVSTGVGGGWIVNGRSWRGASSMAGEIGHVVVDPTGPVCLCGKRGCLERLASGPYIAQDIRAALQQEPSRGQILRQLVNDQIDTMTAQHVSTAAAVGDDLAWERLQRAAWSLGTAIGNTANLVNPPLFVLGGGVMKAGDRFWQVLQQVARETALPEVDVMVRRALLGDDAPLWGAVALAIEAAHPLA